MDDTTYEGWTNWETWNVALWCDNEYGIYQQRFDAKGPWTPEAARDFVLEYFPNGTPDFEVDHMRWWESRGAVNWREIAEHWETDRLENADLSTEAPRERR